MPFQTSDANAEFPFYGVSLITCPNFREDSVGAQVVLKLEPYNILNGNIVRPMTQVEIDGNMIEVVDQSKSVSLVFGDAYQHVVSDPILATALATISQGLQSYINAKGL